jgi:hypothetical protein
MPPPGVAGCEALQREPAALKGAVLADGLQPIGAAGGCEPALGTKQGRYSPLVEADETYEQCCKKPAHFWELGVGNWNWELGGGDRGWRIIVVHYHRCELFCGLCQCALYGVIFGQGRICKDNE